MSGGAKPKVKVRHGSLVHVRTHENRVIEARVCHAEETVAGRKVTVISGSRLNKIDAEQIIDVIRF